MQPPIPACLAVSLAVTCQGLFDRESALNLCLGPTRPDPAHMAFVSAAAAPVATNAMTSSRECSKEELCASPIAPEAIYLIVEYFCLHRKRFLVRLIRNENEKELTLSCRLSFLFSPLSRLRSSYSTAASFAAPSNRHLLLVKPPCRLASVLA